MVQITFDTNNDSVEELQQAMSILQTAINKKSGNKQDEKNKSRTPDQQISNQRDDPTRASSQTKKDYKDEEEKEEDDTPFIKITVHKSKEDNDSNEDEQGDKKSHDDNESRPTQANPKDSPTLNQLISDEGITEEELARMFKGTGIEENNAIPKNNEKRSDKKTRDDTEKAYLEIVDYGEEK